MRVVVEAAANLFGLCFTTSTDFRECWPMMVKLPDNEL